MDSMITSENNPTVQNPRKRFSSETFSHDYKRRLVTDDLSKLNLGIRDPSDPLYTRKTRSPSPSTIFLSDYLDPSSTLPQFDNISKDKVVISNIDQFLKENPDNLDDGVDIRNITDIRDLDMEKIVIPKLELLRCLGFKESDLQEEKVKESVNRIFKQKLKDSNLQVVTSITNSDVLQDLYLLKFWSLIEYYDPGLVTYSSFVKYIERLKLQNDLDKDSHRFEDLDNDGDQDMDSVNVVEPKKNRRISNGQKYKNWTSHYGSYYQPFDTTENSNELHEIKDADDDIMMD
ncbi:hypothetical protein CANARDRAFT_177903 [[Candida] arabinofermentans NRRL YB-2248]|uniref:Uncharacterized protein n=1 Tax=[Candida] arabinofermentans NRRL YB-2248 TaxID=983967 RepID=A0A1E4SUD6_9ASCO|nr:hypothetical protein CANARDRAFT_177903 [[Candida] arabinofermentans NRRL YB-2248]